MILYHFIIQKNQNDNFLSIWSAFFLWSKKKPPCSFILFSIGGICYVRGDYRRKPFARVGRICARKGWELLWHFTERN